MIPDLKYPITAFAKSEVLDFARSKNELFICSSRGLKNGFYKDLNIVDSEGNSFIVEDAKKVGNVGFLWGFNLLFVRKIQVELTFKKEIKNLGLDEFKKMILIKLTKNAGFWDSGGNLKELVKEIKSQESIRAIITYLTNQYYIEY